MGSRTALHRTSSRAAAGFIALAALLGGGALPSQAATTPTPAPGEVPGVASRGGGAVTPAVDVFYRRADGRLALVEGSATGWGSKVDLGGRITSGPAAIIQQPTEFVSESVYARGADGAVWGRVFSDGLGEWLPWRSLGGRLTGAPSVTCIGASSATPVLYVRGTDDALWRRSLDGPWTRVGGALSSSPSAVPATNGQCTSRADVFALGADGAVWEHLAGSWRRLGGASVSAPAALRLPGGQTDVFVRGTDDALWQNIRPASGTAWSGWRRIGGRLTSAPTAAVLPVTPTARAVYALGGNGSLYQGRNVVGTGTWSWTPVP